MKIGGGQTHIISKGAVVVQNAQDRPLAAMRGKPGQTKITPSADDVDFTDDPLLVEVLVGRLDDFSHKLMTQYPPKSHVPFGDFQVRGTDARAANAHERVAFVRWRIWLTRLKAQ